MKKNLLLSLFLCLYLIGQAAVSKSVNCTSGSLSSLLTEQEKSTVTNLTISGTIDARDFKAMRDDMPVLAEVNMSAVSIVEYKGADGTDGAIDITYPKDEIPQWAFCNSSTWTGKTRLTSIIMPESVISIRESAFYACTGLTGSLTIPSTVTSIGSCAFQNCSGFNGLLTIPSSVTSIGYSAFQNCIGFTGSLIIPTSLKSIGDYVFWGCRGLNGTLTIPSTVTSIGTAAFSGCSGLITVDMANPNYSSAEGVLFNKDKTTLISCPTSKTGSYSIPLLVNSIEAYAFNGCFLTGMLTIPSSVTSIGSYAFSNSSLSFIKACGTEPNLITLGTTVFGEMLTSTCKLYVPLDIKVLYAAEPQWNGFMIIDGFPPTVSTQAVSNISTTSVTGNSTITDLGDTNPTQYGVVWSGETNPTVALATKTTQGSISAIRSFTSTITGLTPETKYYVRAYATNSAGTSYGEEVIFTTLPTVKDPATFTAIPGSYFQINLAATANANGEDIVVVYNTTGEFSTPANGTTFGNIGDLFAGGTIFYIGNASLLTNHTGLIKGTEYYYKAFSFNSSYLFSNGFSTFARTNTIEPTNQPTNLTKGAVTTSSIPLTWTPALAGEQLPDGYLIKVSMGNPVIDPADGTDPIDGLKVTNGLANIKVTPCTTSSTYGFNGLQAGTVYDFKIYSYSNAGSGIDYKLSSAPGLKQATLPSAVKGQSYTKGTTDATIATIAWTLPVDYVAGNLTTLVFVKAQSAISTGTPTNSISGYTANTAFGSGTAFQIDDAAFCVYKGDGNNVTVTGLTEGTAYYVSIYTVVDAANSDRTNSYSKEVTIANGVSNTGSNITLVPNGVVFKVASDENYTYIGGDFTTIGKSSGYGAKLSTTSDIPDMSFAKANGTINTCIADGNGGWYIGGEFTQVGTVKRNYLAQLNAKGEVTSWNPNPDDYVKSIAISGNDLYIGGNFATINGVSRINIAKLKITDGTVDESWNPNPDGDWMNIYVISINGTDIYAGGSFNKIGGQSRSNIAKLNTTNGDADNAWNPNPNGTISAINIDNNTVYVGGSFYSIGGQSIKNIARLNTTNGDADVSWNPESDNSVNSIEIYGNDVYAGGYFANIGGQSRKNIAKLNNTDGAADVNWDAGIIDGWTIKRIIVTGSDVFIGGEFSGVGGQPRNNLAKLNTTNGNAEASWNPNLSDVVNCIAINGNELYAGGDFSTFGGQPRNCIARFNNLDGSLDANWNPDVNQTVWAITLKDNDVYIGGYFNKIGGKTKPGIAKLNGIDGSVDNSWDAQSEGIIQSIILNGNDLYVGGNFTSIGGQLRDNIAKLNITNGDADIAWSVNTDGDGVYCMAMNNNLLYVGGLFENIGGIPRNNLARLNITNGMVDPAWNPNADAEVYSLAVNGNDIFAGGFFSTIGGQERIIIAKLNSTNGNADLSWNAQGAGLSLGKVKSQDVASIPTVNDIKKRLDEFMTKFVNKPVSSLTAKIRQNSTSSNPGENGIVFNIIPSGPDIFVGGYFTDMGGQKRNSLAKLSINDAKADANWDPNTDGIIVSMAIAGEDLYAGGQFNQMGGVFQPNFTKLKMPSQMVEYFNVLSSTAATIASTANSTASVEISSNTTWTATIDPSIMWLTVTPSELTSGNATLTFTAQANTGGVRTGIVTISATGIADQTIVVTQKANSQISVPNLILTTTKVYDKTLVAAVNVGALVGVLQGDNVTLQANATYVDENVETGKTIIVVFELSGADKSKYVAPENYSVNVGVITPRPVTITPNVEQSKIYGEPDPTFTYTASEPLQSGDSYNGALSRTAGKDVSTYSYTSGTLSAGSNYALTLGGSSSFSITPRPISITPNAGQTKVYGNVDPTFEYMASESLQSGDSYIGALSRTTGNDVSAYAYKLGTLSAGSNYMLTLGGTNTFSITALAITITADSKSKTYGNADPVFTAQLTAGAILPGDKVLGSLTRTSGENAGTYAINKGTYTYGSNYNEIFVSNDLTIDKKIITVTAVNDSKTYDGNLASIVTPAFDPLAPGDLVDVFPSQVFDNASVGINHMLTASGLRIKSGDNDATGNYTINYVTSPATGVITARQLSVTDPTLTFSKVYDGSNEAKVVAGFLTNIAVGDNGKVSVTAVAIYTDANAGSEKTITVTYSLSGSAAVNYSVPIDFIYKVAAVEIIPKQLTITPPSVVTNKMVDGNTNAVITSIGTLQGVETIDAGNVVVTAKANYNSLVVGVNNSITVVYTLNGTAADNYIIPANYIITEAKISDNMTLSPLSDPTAGCENSLMELIYTLLSGTPVQYALTFNSPALAGGIQNVPYTNLPGSESNGNLSFAIPKGMPDGTYQGTLKVRNELGIESNGYSFNFTINVSSDNIIPKFNDVVICDNSSKRFTSYQWYKNGVIVDGATKQFYNDLDGLVGSYYAKVRTTDGQSLFTCAKTFNIPLTQKISVYPSPVKINETCTVRLTGVSSAEMKGADLSVYNLQGVLIYRSKEIENLNYITLPPTDGMYVGRMTTASNKEFLFKVIVIR